MSLLALTDAQISTWVASFMLPLFRVGALLTTMPIIGTTLVPKRIKLFLSLAITLAIMPSLPPLPTVNPLDLSGLMLIAGATLRPSAPGTIRGDFSHMSFVYADDVNRGIPNLIHASGDDKEAIEEIAHWFSDDEIYEYAMLHEKFTR